MFRKCISTIRNALSKRSSVKPVPVPKTDAAKKDKNSENERESLADMLRKPVDKEELKKCGINLDIRRLEELVSENKIDPDKELKINVFRRQMIVHYVARQTSIKEILFKDWIFAVLLTKNPIGFFLRDDRVWPTKGTIYESVKRKKL